MRTQVRAMCLAATTLVFAFASVETNAQERTVRVTLLVRLTSDSTRAPVDQAAFVVDSTRLRAVSGDSAGRYEMQLALSIGSHRLTVRRIGYDIHRIEFNVHGEGRIDLGAVAMWTTSYLHADDIPYCVRVLKQPKELPPLTWLTPAPDSAGRKTWIFCDARRR